MMSFNLGVRRNCMRAVSTWPKSTHIVHVLRVSSLGRSGTEKLSHPESSGRLTTSDPPSGEDASTRICGKIKTNWCATQIIDEDVVLILTVYLRNFTCCYDTLGCCVNNTESSIILWYDTVRMLRDQSTGSQYLYAFGRIIYGLHRSPAAALYAVVEVGSHHSWQGIFQETALLLRKGLPRATD